MAEPDDGRSSERHLQTPSAPRSPLPEEALRSGQSIDLSSKAPHHVVQFEMEGASQDSHRRRESDTRPKHTDSSQIKSALTNFIGIGQEKAAQGEKTRWDQKRLRRLYSKYPDLTKDLKSLDITAPSASSTAVDPAVSLEAGRNTRVSAADRSSKGILSVQTPAGATTTSGSHSESISQLDSVSQVLHAEKKSSVPKVVFDSLSSFVRRGTLSRQKKHHPSFASRSSFDYEQINQREFQQDDFLNRLAADDRPSPQDVLFKLGRETPPSAGMEMVALGEPRPELIRMSRPAPPSSSFTDKSLSRMRRISEAAGRSDVIVEETSVELENADGEPHPEIEVIEESHGLPRAATFDVVAKGAGDEMIRPFDLFRGDSVPYDSKEGAKERWLKEEPKSASATATRRILKTKQNSIAIRLPTERTMSIADEVFFDVPPTPTVRLRHATSDARATAQGPNVPMSAASASFVMISDRGEDGDRTSYATIYDADGRHSPEMLGTYHPGRRLMQIEEISALDSGDSRISQPPKKTKLGPVITSFGATMPDRPKSPLVVSEASGSSVKHLVRQKPVEEDDWRKVFENLTDMLAAKIQVHMKTGERKPRLRGIGVCGKFFGRILNRKNVSSLPKELKDIIESGEDERPFFTYWVTTVQIIVCIASIIFYGVGPFGFDRVEQKEEVIDTTLVYRTVSYYEPANIFVGPKFADLIRLGAKYSPCMRREVGLWNKIEAQQKQESMTGCCIFNDHSGCYQTGESTCPINFGTWVRWKNETKMLTRSKSDSELTKLRKQEISNMTAELNLPTVMQRTSGAVCGQDPKYCEMPLSVEPYEWPDDLTKWPICTKVHQGLHLPSHMTCQVTGRPCCIQLQGLCRITTQEYCDFVNGHWHANATLCSQVDCFSDICGMLPFLYSQWPNQFYRLFLSLFIHAGVLHLACTVLVQFTVMRDLEKLIGWERMALLYFVSGIGGNLASAIFVPYNPEVGPSGSQLGILAALIVDVYHHRCIIDLPKQAYIVHFTTVFLLFVSGLLPWIDNWAHIFGFIFGLLTTIATFPYLDFPSHVSHSKIGPTSNGIESAALNTLTPTTDLGSPTVPYAAGEDSQPLDTFISMIDRLCNNILKNISRRAIFVSIAVIIELILFSILTYVFFWNVQFECSWCSLVNCINWTFFTQNEHFCDNQGQELTQWLPI